MKFKVEKQEELAILEIEEEKITSLIAPELKSELIVLNSAGYRYLIVDLNHTNIIDSSGLSAMLMANRICSDARGAFALCNLNEHVKKMVTIAQLDKVLNIIPTRQEAIDNLKLHMLERELQGESSTPAHEEEELRLENDPGASRNN